MDQVQEQFSNLYWAYQEHNTETVPLLTMFTALWISPIKIQFFFIFLVPISQTNFTN